MEYDYELLLKLTRDIPHDLDFDTSPEPSNKETRDKIFERDKVCRLCGKEGEIVHHIIPNEETKPENLVLMCKRCHIVIHEILSIAKKWKNTTFVFRRS